MTYVVIIGALLVAVVIMLFFKNVTTFISLLTAISALILGLYQLSKDKRQIDFMILLGYSTSSEGKKTYYGYFTIVNTGYLPVYFQNARSPIPTAKTAIFVYSDGLDIPNFFKKTLNQINKKWFSPFKNNLSMEDFVISESDINKNNKPTSVIVKSGDTLQFEFKLLDYMQFFKKGRRFFIMDANNNIFYLKQESVDAMKKVLEKYEKYEKNQTNAK